MYFCIDLKSFYASCECVLLGVDPFKTGLVVADIERGEGSVVLAVTPYLKQRGLQSRSQIRDIPKEIRHEIIFMKPKMKRYLEFSWKVYEVLLKFCAPEDIFSYSIDEAFLNIAPYQSLYPATPEELGHIILDAIYEQTGLPAACGIGENLFLAKVALDVYAKKVNSNVICLTKELFNQEIITHRPLSDIWSIGRNIEKRLDKMKLYTLLDIQRAGQRRLEEEFGIIGAELYQHAWGEDDAKISDIKQHTPIQKSFSHAQALFEDYEMHDAETLVIEMTDILVLELIQKQYEAQTISLGVRYGYQANYEGFSKTTRLDPPSCQYSVIVAEMKKLYWQYVSDHPIRRIAVGAGGLIKYDLGQQTLFASQNKEKEVKLFQSINEIKSKYGKNAVNRSISYTEKGQQRNRNKLLGGHNSE